MKELTEKYKALYNYHPIQLGDCYNNAQVSVKDCTLESKVKLKRFMERAGQSRFMKASFSDFLKWASEETQVYFWMKGLDDPWIIGISYITPAGQVCNKFIGSTPYEAAAIQYCENQLRDLMGQRE